MRPEFIIVHHSLTRDSGTVSWGAIRSYHINELGYKDIGYHAGVELVVNGPHRYYEIFHGRMWDEVGAHTRGLNHRSLGICFVGNWDVEPPPDDQLITGAKLLRYWCRLFNISLHNIHPHSAHAPKTCPGSLFDMNLLRQYVEGV